MNQVAKILLIAIGACAMVGLSACVSFDPTRATVSSDSTPIIADFDLPAEYRGELRTNLLGYSVLAFSRGDGPNHLYLIQSEKASDGERLAKMLDSMVVGSGDPQTRMKVVETRQVSVRGQTTTLVISDCVNSEGRTYRQAAVAFQGNRGPTLLLFAESLRDWNQATVDRLLASIR